MSGTLHTLYLLMKLKKHSKKVIGQKRIFLMMGRRQTLNFSLGRLGFESIKKTEPLFFFVQDIYPMEIILPA